MSTWHQARARIVRLDHETEWTVVIDPPHELRSAISFSTEAAAREYLSRSQHSYILPPRGKAFS